MTRLEDARAIVRPLLGAKPNARKLAQSHGISHVTFESAIAIEKAMLAGPLLAEPKPVKAPTKVHPMAEMFPLMEGRSSTTLSRTSRRTGSPTTSCVQKATF